MVIIMVIIVICLRQSKLFVYCFSGVQTLTHLHLYQGVATVMAKTTIAIRHSQNRHYSE